MAGGKEKRVIKRSTTTKRSWLKCWRHLSWSLKFRSVSGGKRLRQLRLVMPRSRLSSSPGVISYSYSSSSSSSCLYQQGRGGPRGGAIVPGKGTGGDHHLGVSRESSLGGWTDRKDPKTSKKMVYYEEAGVSIVVSVVILIPVLAVVFADILVT